MIVAVPLSSASRVGPYEILATLGGGSMGEVYVAQDSRLNRRVALKILSAESLQDRTRRRRFAQEARSASALNHPNIVTIHDFGTIDGIYYIVSELIQGESLRDIINRGPVPTRLLLDLATQIASGLAAAHASGIVHRDLKPENIMVTPDNRVKILDFGLAKPVGDSEMTDDDAFNAATSDGRGSNTQPGLILGTVGYMSPEQARGMPLGFASDQFSLGVILHEMATGQHPFRRETPMQTLLEIANLNRIPFTPGPVAFRLLAARCLSREPEARFASTAEIYERLRRIRDELHDMPAVPQVIEAARLRVRRAFPREAVVRALTLVLVFCLGLLTARLLSRPSTPALENISFTPLATERSLEVFPAFSRNGKSVAYAAGVNGILQIFARPLRSSSATQLTRAAENCLFPFWSADGTRVYYISEKKLWFIGASGGSPELVFDNVSKAAASPDGSLLALLRRDAAGSELHSLWLAYGGKSPARYESGKLRGKQFAGSTYMAFSPDGKHLGLWAADPDGHTAFWMIPVNGGPAREYGVAAPTPQMFSWMPDSARIVFSASQDLVWNNHLWMSRFSGGSRHEITTGTGREEAPTVAPDGNTIAFASTRLRYTVQQIPIWNNGQDTPARSPAAASQESAAWSPVREEYAFVTDHSGIPEIWLKDTHSGWQRKIVSGKDFPDTTLFLSDISFSPEGERIAYRRGGEHSDAIWISALAGEAPFRIARESTGAIQRSPTWSPDGNWIAYSSLRSGKPVLMKARSDGSGSPVMIRADAGTHPVWSPDGQSIATLGAMGLSIVSADGSATRSISSGEWLNTAWTRHGSDILGLRRTGKGELQLVSIRPDGSSEQVRTLIGQYPAVFSYGTALGASAVGSASISLDSHYFLTSVLEGTSDLWLMSGFRK